MWRWGATLGFALVSINAAAQEPFVISEPIPIPMFVGQWTIAGRDVTCGTWPRTLEISEADSSHIVADGKEYRITKLTKRQPKFEKDEIETQDWNFTISGDKGRLMMISFKANGRVTGDCPYVRVSPIQRP
jgi:hypothetical protein